MYNTSTYHLELFIAFVRKVNRTCVHTFNENNVFYLLTHIKQYYNKSIVFKLDQETVFLFMFN